MKIDHQKVNLSVQGEEIEEIQSELNNILYKMNAKTPEFKPIPTQNKLIDGLANTIFEQDKRIKQLEGHIAGSDLSRRINKAIENIQAVKATEALNKMPGANM